ncbi:MAG: hypothetical protein OHK0022_21480 [Roseiflexaceae bacterium]
MSNDDIREQLKRKLNAPPAMPIEATRSFLRSYFSDALNLDEAVAEIKTMAKLNTRTLYAGLNGIESLLEEDVAPGVLSMLVAADANYVLDDPSDAGARKWLQEIADILRTTLQAS